MRVQDKQNLQEAISIDDGDGKEAEEEKGHDVSITLPQ